MVRRLQSQNFGLETVKQSRLAVSVLFALLHQSGKCDQYKCIAENLCPSDVHLQPPPSFSVGWWTFAASGVFPGISSLPALNHIFLHNAERSFIYQRELSTFPWFPMRLLCFIRILMTRGDESNTPSGRTVSFPAGFAE